MVRKIIEEIKTYKTSDGKLFDDKKKAEKHELELQKIKIYRVHYNPELNEGKGYLDVGYVFIHANNYHEMFLKDWLHKKFGNPISFVMGVYGSNAIMDSYTWYEVAESEVDARIEELMNYNIGLTVTEYNQAVETAQEIKK